MLMRNQYDGVPVQVNLMRGLHNSASSFIPSKKIERQRMHKRSGLVASVKDITSSIFGQKRHESYVPGSACQVPALKDVL